MKTNLWTILIAIALLSGCDGKKEDVGSAGTGSGESTGSTAATSPGQQKPTLAQVPANLKHEAFDYYGLGNSKTLDVKLSGASVSQQTGGISVELDKIEGDSAHFKVVRTGAVGDSLGTDFVMVDAKGVHATGNSMGKLTPASYLALPADLTPGKTWSVKNKIERENGQQVEEDSIYKVEGLRDFKTKSGMEKALLVTSTGTASVTTGEDKKKMTSTTKSWYLKGVGLAKSEISFTLPGQPTNTIIVELTS